MIPWKRGDAPTLDRSHFPALTADAFQALRWLALCHWPAMDDAEIDEIRNRLKTLAIHWDDCVFIIDALRAYYDTDLIAGRKLLDFLESMRALFFPEEERPGPTAPDADWSQCLDLLSFEQVGFSPSKLPRMHYVVHLFSGVKREHDIHSSVAALPTPASGILCPISLDVVLDRNACDLLCPQVQDFWISKARDGFIHLFVMGPPCETWSISRLRQIVDDQGPRPVRASDDDWHLWAKPVLRLKELLQVSVGNSLLQLCMLLVAVQAIAGRHAILEHPMCGESRYGVLPPSIWRLEAMKLLLRHPHISSFDIRQGSYGGKSPKPTTLLIAAARHLRSTIATILDHGRTNMVQPPAVVMGRADHHPGYNTAPLKRYPPGLCKSIAKLAYVFAEAGALTDPMADDGLHELAANLEGLYQTVVEGATDGADFCGDAASM